MFDIGIKTAEKRKSIQRRYREKRARFMNVQFRAMTASRHADDDYLPQDGDGGETETESPN